LKSACGSRRIRQTRIGIATLAVVCGVAACGWVTDPVPPDSSVRFFQPVETKGRLFEFGVGSEIGGFILAPGPYHVRGSYARRSAAYDTVTVSP
jgi:hypothetical protein